MALRSPIYLDTETLLSQAEYHEIKVPQQADIVEKTVRNNATKVDTSGLGMDSSTGTDVEYQSTYRLQPSEKATVSRVIDSLIANKAVQISPYDKSKINRDDLIEIEGNTRITTASHAGKMFFIFRRLMETAEGDLDSIFDLNVEDTPVAEQLKQVYLQNELLPIPILLELTDSSFPQKVYVNMRPDHFIDEASVNRIEGNLRVLGSVRQVIPGGNDGYLSAEEWILYDWEYVMRRKMMTDVDDIVRDLAQQIDLKQPPGDVHSSIAGPAILVDAIALY